MGRSLCGDRRAHSACTCEVNKVDSIRQGRWEAFIVFERQWTARMASKTLPRLFAS